MRSSRRTEASLKHPSELLTDHSVGTELTSAWKSLSQSKAALRHIENRTEATPGSGVLLDSIIDPHKKKSTKTVQHREGRKVDDPQGPSKARGGSQQSPVKSSSRSPLRNTTQDSNVRKNGSVEFREPLASYREATPPPHRSSQLEAYNLQSVSGSSYPSSSPQSEILLSRVVYERDNRDKQTDRDLDSTQSSAVGSTEVRYLNDQPALDVLKTEDKTLKAQLGMDSQESCPHVAPTPGSSHQRDSTPSSSPGSASQRLENLRRHQPDNKLEKLKERIRRQRQHLEESAERDKLQGHQEQPIVASAESRNVAFSSMPSAKIRKVTAAPPARMYKGFSSTEIKIRTPDGKVWKEEDFHNFSREIYKDLSRQFAESSRSKHHEQRELRAERAKERRPSKPVRKVHRAAPASDPNSKPAISPASWREGQKMVKMVLGPAQKPRREEHSSCSNDRRSQTASRHPHSEADRRSLPNGTEKMHDGFQGRTTSQPATPYKPPSAAQDTTPLGVNTDLLSADIQGILEDLQLDLKPAEKEERARKRSRGGNGGRRGRGGSGSRTRAPVSAWGATVAAGGVSRGCRSASPTTRRSESSHPADRGQKKRHYDANTVRQYIARQQEERKRRQAEEKKAMREEAERRSQRLQELYRKQREVAKTVIPGLEATVAPVQKRLQETYNKLLLDEAYLEEETSQTHVAPSIQMRPMYQPSGESDKENKRQETPQSPSSSDKSLNDQPPPPLSRDDLDIREISLLRPAVQPPTGPSTRTVQAPSNEYLFSQLLRLDAAVAAGKMKYGVQPATSPSHRPLSKISRIEALKAKATSLSNRIESEARKLAGQGINYGDATSMDADAIMAPRTSAFDVSVHATENGDMPQRVQGFFSHPDQNSYGGIAFPGAGAFHDFRGKREKTHTTFTQSHMVSSDVKGPAHEKKRLFSGLDTEENADKVALKTKYCTLENNADPLDSSAGSISEGPLLSDGSFSEEGASPPHPSHCHVPVPDRLQATECSASLQRLMEFQKEAARYSALSPPFLPPGSSKAPWEELNEGSPLSVINIFTKNLHGNVKVGGVSERNSPPAHSLYCENGPKSAEVYEEDFVSSHSSRASDNLKRRSNSPSVNGHFEELLRRSPFEKSTRGISSYYSSFHSPSPSQHRSSGSPSGSSPLSRHSARKRGTASDQSDATLVEEQRSSCSPLSEALSSDSRKRGSDKSPAHTHTKILQSNDAVGDGSGRSPHRPRLASPSGSPGSLSPQDAFSSSDLGRNGSQSANHMNKGASAQAGELQYSPAVLQQRMAVELHYLESIEESIKQLGDVERLMDVSMAQQESASLAQMLEAKQHRHERELYELKIKAEREALETKLQLEENRQRVARAHIELQESLAASQKEALEGLQESTTKMMSQQAEAARHTADAARHIKEMAELARSQIAGSLTLPPVATDSAMLDYLGEDGEDGIGSLKVEDKPHSDSEMSSRRTRSEEPLSSLNSLSHSGSASFKKPSLSGPTSSGSLHSSSLVMSGHREKTKKEAEEGKTRTRRTEDREAAQSSIEEDIPQAANDSICSESIPSVVDDKGETTSVATEYSFKFDESMTEDEIEERSFRSLLPSEAHRRGTMEMKSRNHEESEDDGAIHNLTVLSGTETHNTFKSHDTHIAFSGGQDSFSQFTMDMVRQYMKDEEVRLQHQSSLLRLRQKALKEKTRTELAWLELQKKRLRDKGEDDKMPPIRKKQRGLLIKLQQEQAEIKRLQEANKAARKERQLLLKQQEEIERMRNSTLRLKERLKCAEGQTPPETPVFEPPRSESAAANLRLPDEVRSPSPSPSISGSETSSIMQKLKKMRSHMDEKFLTKREQRLMQRRHHAEELLQWKQRLDQEEAEVHQMEREALALWDQKKRLDKEAEISLAQGQEISEMSSHLSPQQRSEPKTDCEKEIVSECDFSSVTPDSSVHTERSGSQQQGSPTSAQPASVPLTSVHTSPANYTQDFTSLSQPASRRSSLLKGSSISAASPSDASCKTKMQLRSASQTPSEVSGQLPDPRMATQAETTSDQSDIENRIRTLKEELRKRKFMAYQLKKEQKKRHKERLKAQEASLLKQLENYNNFIEKTKAELNKEPESTSDINSQSKDCSSVLEQSSTKPSPQRTEASLNPPSEKTLIGASLHHKASAREEESGSTSAPKDLSDEEPLTPVEDVYGETKSGTPGQRSHQSSESRLRPSTRAESGDERVLTENRSEIQEELELEVSSKFEEEHSQLEKEAPEPQQRLLTPDGDRQHSPSVCHEQDKQVNRSEISEVREKASPDAISGQHASPAVDLELSPHASYSPDSNSPDSVALSLNKEAPLRDVEVSPTADAYHDDFESIGSSPRQEYHYSKPESQISGSPTETKALRKDSYSKSLTHDSQDEAAEEEIAEELSHHSDGSERSHQSGRLLLDLNQPKEDFKHENSSNSSRASPVSPPQSGSPSPVADEMPSFSVGDRVLVGSVQPGTLRFKGPTSFANGFWAGVELDKSEGSNNGTYDGVVYFECEKRHGIFAPPDKITHLPEKFELYTDTTEDDDSFLDDQPDKNGNKHKGNKVDSQKQGNLENENEHVPHEDTKSGEKKLMDEENQAQLVNRSYLNSQHHKESPHTVPNGNAGDIILDFRDASETFIISDKQTQKETAPLIKSEEADSEQHFSAGDLSTAIDNDEGEQKGRDVLDTVADKLLNNFVKDTVKQFADIKKAKEQKIRAANQMIESLLGSKDDEEWMVSVEQKDGLPFFLPVEKEELSSPELCNRPESPVFGASGQEELAKRLAELELSRELFDEIADDQDWFDEDYGLSSRREQQRLKLKEERGKLGGESATPPMGGMGSSLAGEPQVKTPPRPELPLPLPPKLPEQPAMVVPHSATEVEKMVHAATKEILETYHLGKEGALTRAPQSNPRPSVEFLGKDPSSQDQEALSIRSYKKAVYDLTWEILHDIYAEEPNADQPQWVKAHRVKSSSVHRVKTSGDINKIQEFVSAEVLKLYGLKQDQSQKTDWQKMLKFGRKKRDRVDHILVQELHEEEAQWVNYDEDELFVKMQLADSIFDALIKDTASVFTLISEKRAGRDPAS